MTHLRLLIFLGQKNITEFLIDNKAIVNIVDFNDVSPLQLAVRSGNEKISREIGRILYFNGIFIISFIYSEQSDIVRLLIEKGADVNYVNKFNRSALYYAAHLGKPNLN